MSSCCVIATYGDFHVWDPLIHRAFESANNQTVPFDRILCWHDRDLASARNYAATALWENHYEWICFLDADDELDPGYNEAMLKASGDIRRPCTLGVVNGREDDFPVMLPRKNPIDGNFMVIGSFVRTEQFLRVGGFDEYPVLEDWAFFLKCIIDGATIGDVPEAIYKVHVTPNSRNTNASLHGRVYSEIRAKYAEQLRSITG